MVESAHEGHAFAELRATHVVDVALGQGVAFWLEAGAGVRSSRSTGSGYARLPLTKQGFRNISVCPDRVP